MRHDRGRRRLLRSVPLLATMIMPVVVGGCGSNLVDIRRNVDFYRTSLIQQARTDASLLSKFATCSAAAPIDAHPSRDGWSDRVRGLVHRIGNVDSARRESLTILADLSTDLDQVSSRRLDLGRLRRFLDSAALWQQDMDGLEHTIRSDASRFTLLLSAYIKAYFGDLEYVADPHASGSALRRVRPVTSSGFVDRGGNRFLFPALAPDTSASTSSSGLSGRTITSQTISADLTRLFLEAFFDAAFEVPAVRDATALRVAWPPNDASYPAFDIDHPPIPVEALARVTRQSLRAEAAVTAEVGRTVRGAGVFGTGNETVAAAMETAAGVIAKKLVEYEGFCYFRTMAISGSMSERSSSTGGEAQPEGTK
ncbi:MAG TPA: hypothetical protein VFS39_04995 [Nitrospira sp.]|nr:hypothetical protein [Nitrospira sp.]